MAETTTNTWWDALERWSPTAFLIAGVFWLVYAGLSGIEVVADVITPSALDVAVSGLALLIAAISLLGLYPRLRDHMPRISLVGIVCIAVSAVSTLALLVWLFGTTLLTAGVPAIPEDAPGWTVAAFFLALLPLLMGFLLFGVAALRTAALSRFVGLLLIVPAVMWVGLLAGNAIGIGGNAIGVLVYVPIAVAALAIAARLRTGTDRPCRGSSDGGAL